ncbi:MAG: spermidine/putrescine transport system permease protein [Clostridiales bacterium]|jgi:spermidine/putrescine transport system permease protein|nr:spermidine/putrescine transport system permease protein [Clostridiales bacterium]MDN5298733.1 spermidine/putrescine transport system permease protein [Clostridiales bacterium]
MVMKWIKRIYAGLIFIFLYAPIAVLVVFSFNDAKSTAKWEGFTFKWYRTLLENDYIMKSLYYTILIAVIASLLATVIGTFAAFGIHYAKQWRQKLIMNINSIPILNPDIVTGISLMTLFLWMGLERGFITMLLAHMTFCIPYVILSVLPKMKQMPADVLEAAMDLGATPWMAFKKVILPEISPGIISGALIAFTLSIDDFVISFFTAGNGVTNLSIAIYSMARRGIKPEINALSTLMFITILILLIAINKRTSNIEEL